MGIGTITRDVGHVASSLQTWTAMVADAARLHGPTRGALTFRTVHDADVGLATVDEALVRTVGWEMRDAVAWRPDGFCVQRADLTVLSAAQRLHGGDLAAAYGNVAQRDGRTGAQLVAYAPARPGLGFEARFHSAALFRTPDNNFVVDHLVASSPDGVMTADDWLRAVQPRDASDVAIVAATHRPPMSVTAGIGKFAVWLNPTDWLKSGDELTAARVR